MDPTALLPPGGGGGGWGGGGGGGGAGVRCERHGRGRVCVYGTAYVDCYLTSL